MLSTMIRAGLLAAFAALSWPAAGREAQARNETLDQAVCRLIETSALTHGVPADMFTRLIWRESSFRPRVISSAGAQGIAQFMPGTATDNGLEDPFDPEQAIPAAATLLVSLKDQFGSWGLALAAYNAGPGRVAGWQAKGGFLPRETERYVRAITSRSIYDWARPDGLKQERARLPPQNCLAIVAALRTQTPALFEGPYAPFGIQLSGNFSKALALASYERVAARFPDIVGGRRTLIIGTRMAGRGRQAFYRVRLPATSMKEANNLCARLHKAGGACIVLRN